MTIFDTIKKWVGLGPAAPQPTAPVPLPPAGNFPPVSPFGPPPFPPLVSNASREAIFGSFEYVSAPTRSNPEAIRITDGWDHENIIWVDIPQLDGIEGAEYRGPNSAGMYFHKRGAQQLRDLWAHWEAADLLHHVLTFEGSYVPRFVRGSRSTLSNHCFGNAFDINYQWNQLGATPAAVGSKGSVRALVPIATVHGFFWGGFYATRKDGMHFEVAKLVS